MPPLDVDPILAREGRTSESLRTKPMMRMVHGIHIATIR